MENNINVENEVLKQFKKDEDLNFQHFIDWCCANQLDYTMKNLDKYIDEVK